VLVGAENIIKSNHPIIFIETHKKFAKEQSAKALNYLYNLGYKDEVDLVRWDH